MRLLDGADNSSGRIEYCKHGTWGSVCSDGWDDRDARVVCHQLGFNPAGMQQNHIVFSYGTYLLLVNHSHIT